MAGQNRALILLIHDRGIQLMSWQRRKLVVVEEYRNTSADHEAFAAQLRNYPDYGVVVVTDLIDENFRHDLIVHVSGADRDALIKRKLDFTFRNTRYRIGRVKGREKDGRKQDKLLLAAVSKPEVLDIWVNLLLEEKRAIQSITSMAWLLRNYLPLQKLDKETTLLIASIDPGNSLRQTFFMEGKLMFSRLTNLTAENGADLASEVHNESLQVRQYLERIQFVQYEAPLRIQALSTLNSSELPLTDHTNESNRFEQIDITDELKKLGIIDNGFAVTAIHYVLAKVLTAVSPPNIYAPANVTRYHDLLRLGRNIAIAAGLLLLIGIGGNLPLGLSVKEKREQMDSLVARTEPLLSRYDELNNSFPDTPIPASEMALIVQAHDRIATQVLRPLPALNMLSAALARSSGVQLTGVTWELERIPPETTADPQQQNQPVTSLAGVTTDTEFAGATLQQQTRIKITVTGESYAPTSIRQAQQQVENLVAAISEYPNISIESTLMPTDVRTDMPFTTTVDDREVRAPFTIELTEAIKFPVVAEQVAVQP